MLTLTKPFTDSHGITHDAAVIIVQSFSFSQNSSVNGNAEIGADNVVTYATPAEYSHSALRFSASLYPSLAAFEQGKLPLNLHNVHNMAEFTIEQPSLAAAATASDIVTLCEQYILTEVVK